MWGREDDLVIMHEPQGVLTLTLIGGITDDFQLLLLQHMVIDYLKDYNIRVKVNVDRNYSVLQQVAIETQGFDFVDTDEFWWYLRDVLCDLGVVSPYWGRTLM